MAQIKMIVTPKPSANRAATVFTTDSGEFYAPVLLTVPINSTYSTTDKVKLVHDGVSDFSSQLGARTIKQVLCEPFACNNVSFGTFKFGWLWAAQLAGFLIQGNGGSVAPTGPLDETEMANGTALGTGLITANALIFW